MKNRKKAEEVCLSVVQELDPSGYNTKRYKQLFKYMSDEDFDIMMHEIKDKRNGISIIAPNGHPTIKLDLDRNKKIMEKRGIKLFQQLTITNGGDTYRPAVKFMVMPLPVSRMAQTISKNFSVHEHLKSRNVITGQVTGSSSAGGITLNEINILKSLGLNSTLKEFVGIRGGDEAASSQFRSILFNEGRVTMKEMKPFITKTGSTKALKALFKAIHLDVNI